MPAVISFRNVTKVYRDGLTLKTKTALQSLTLEVQKGEIFGFLGPNGAGKSTAIKVLLNLLYPTSGQVHLLGREAADPQSRREVGYLPELPYLYDNLSVSELLWFGGRASGLPRARIRERVDLLLETVNLKEARRQAMRTFSKGMLQRAGLAMALIHDPQMVILDEPMTGLDPLGRRLVSDVIRGLKEEGKTVFFSSHILSDAADLCDRVGILVDGRLNRLLEIQEISLAPPKGWRVVVDGLSDSLSAFLNRNGATIRGNRSWKEIRWSDQDVYALLEQIRSEKQKLILLEPLKETLEEIFLREIEKAKIRGM